MFVVCPKVPDPAPKFADPALENPDEPLPIELKLLLPLENPDDPKLLLLAADGDFVDPEFMLFKFEFISVDVRSLTCGLTRVVEAGFGCSVVVVTRPVELSEVGDVRLGCALNSFCCSCCCARRCFSSSDNSTCQTPKCHFYPFEITDSTLWKEQRDTLGQL